MTGQEIFDRINLFNPNIKEEDYIINPQTGETLAIDLQQMYYAGKNEESIQLIMEIFECDKEIATDAYNTFKNFWGTPPSAQQIARANAEARELLNKPKCPICNSTNLSKITATKKIVKIAAFGIFGMGDNGKTWKCNNCGSKF